MCPVPARGAPRLCAVLLVTAGAFAACSESNEGGTPGGGANGGSGATGGASAAGGSSAAGSGGGSSASGGTAGSTGGGASGSGGTGGGSADAAPEVCDATCHFVRADAPTGGDGASWSTAWQSLPDTLERGHRYYVADGDYPAYTFDDPAADVQIVTIVKATAGRHGSEAGWQDAYGDGSASFGPLSFTDPYYVVDGGAGRGLRVVGDFQGDVVTIDAAHVTLQNADIDGAFAANASGQHVAGACTGLSAGGTNNVRIEGCEIHDVADDGVSLSNVQEVDFVGNVVHALHACGTDGGCGPCYNGHSDGIETYDVEHGRFIGNFVYDVRSTATFFFGNWADSLGNGPSEYCEDMLLENNVFYAPEVGLVAYIQDANGVRAYNNVFWGVRQGGYGGLSVGQHVTGLYLYNNVILSINLAHTGGTFNPAEHHGDYNVFGVSLGQWQDSANDRVMDDPGFTAISAASGTAVTSPQPADFSPVATSPLVDTGYAGDATISIPSTDFFGAARVGQPDVGAIERQ